MWQGEEMSIKPICIKCNKELEDFGAILLSPPNPEGLVVKEHICKKCYKKEPLERLDKKELHLILCNLNWDCEEANKAVEKIYGKFGKVKES